MNDEYEISARNAANQDFMPLMRALVRAYQAFSSFDADAHRASGSGLTVPQADVVFTLGNTDGMICSEISERTLITKGTLTGVIDRLRAKGVVERWEDAYDGRRTIVALTEKGQAIFEDLFPRHIALIKSRFDTIQPQDQKAATLLLKKIQDAFAQ